MIRNLDSIFICQHFHYYFTTPWINYDQKYIFNSSLESWSKFLYYQKKKKKIHGLIGINTNMIIKYNFTGRTQLNLNCQIQIYRNQHKYDDKILVIIIFLFNLQNRNEWLPTVSHVSLTSYAITNCTVSWPSVWLFLRNCCFIFILLTLYAYLENSMHLYIPCQRFD